MLGDTSGVTMATRPPTPAAQFVSLVATRLSERVLSIQHLDGHQVVLSAAENQ